MHGRIRIFLAILLTMLPMTLASCGTAEKQPTTRIDPASIRQSDTFKDQGEGTTEVVITPAPPSPPSTTLSITTQPAAAAVISAPPAPGAAPSSFTVNGNTVTAPAGSGVSYKHTDPASTAENRDGVAMGPTLRTNGPMDANFKSEAPELNFGQSQLSGPSGISRVGKASGSGGGTSFEWVDKILAVVSSPAGTNWLAGIGIALIVGGILMIVVEHIIGGLADWALFALIELAGLSLLMLSIVIAQHPMLFILFVLALVGGFAWYVIYWKKKSTVVTATTTTTAPATTTTSTILSDAAAAEDRLVNRLKMVLGQIPDPAATATTAAPPTGNATLTIPTTP